MKECATPGFIITAANVCAFLLFSLFTHSVVSAETTVQGKVINAPARIENSANIAAGSDNKATHSSVALKNVRMGGTIVNSVQNKNAVNIAAGKGNSASQGSVTVSRAAIKGSVVNNVSTKSTVNMAAGRENQANQASVVVKSASVKGNISNTAMGKNMLNAAIGSRNQANQSTVIVKNSTLSGKLLNQASGSSTINMAAGADNKADQGSVRVESSRISGTVVNTSTLKKSANLAVGKQNTASQASIVSSGAQVTGTVINTAAGDDSVNAAIGFGNEAHQSSVVLDGEPGRNRALIDETSKSAAGGTIGQGLVNMLPMAGIEGGGQAPAAGPAAKPVRETQKNTVPEHVPGQVVFLVDNDKAGLASLDRIAKKYQLKVGEKSVLKSLDRIMVVSSTDKDAAAIAEALKNESGVYSSQPNYVFNTMGQQDPMSSMQNVVNMLDLQEVHSKVTGKNVTVAVVDTGVELEHQDLRSRIVGYQNFISDSEYRGEMHGTAVAGIIGAARNAFGIVGIAPDVGLLALRACRQVGTKSSLGECFSTSLAQSLDVAITAQADVVNLSLGALVNDTLLGMMIDTGSDHGIIFAAPVGNDADARKIAFPASHDKVISIAGLDEDGNPLPNKRLAEMADTVAPATHLFVTSPGNNYNFSDGTSLASAAISGILALSMEKKIAQNGSCLPHFNSPDTWQEQVRSCIGF